MEIAKVRDLFTPEQFCAALISALVTEGINSIRPRSAQARKGFRAVLEKLDTAIEKQVDPNRLYQLLKIRTSLAPSLGGAYDSFETYLRALQTSMVSSPNPALADLEFNVSSSYASSSLEELDDEWASLVKSAASAFKNLGQLPDHERRPELSRT